MAELHRARRRRLVPFRVGDGGMNPVFAAKLASPATYSTITAASIRSPAILRSPAVRRCPARCRARPIRLPRRRSGRQASKPVVMASVPLPQPAPQPKEGDAPPEQPKTIAGLLGNLFGGSQGEAQPAEPAESQTRSPCAAAIPKWRRNRNASAPVRTAAASPSPSRTKPRRPSRRRWRQTCAGPSASALQQADKPNAKPPAPEMRTAYSRRRRRQQRPAAGRAAGGSGRLVREPLDRAALTSAL